MTEFIHLFMQLFIRQQIFIEFLLRVLHGAGCWGYSGKQERYDAYLHGTYSVMGETRDLKVLTMKGVTQEWDLYHWLLGSEYLQEMPPFNYHFLGS